MNCEELYWIFFEIYNKKMYLYNRKYKRQTLLKDFLRRQKYSIKIWLKFKINSLKSKLFFNHIIRKFEKEMPTNKEKKKLSFKNIKKRIRIWYLFWNLR